MHFTRAARRRHAELDVTLNLPGVHNVRNALAAIAVATELDVPDAAIVEALAEFTRRRPPLPAHGEVSAPAGGHFTLIDDYGHHPAEMAATLQAARGAFPGRRIVLAFQPHRYTRTRDCFEDFVKCCRWPTRCCWPRSIPPAKRRSCRRTAARWRARCAWPARSSRCSSNRSMIPAAVLDVVRDGDVVIAMGAGSIGQLAAKLTGGGAE